MNVRLDSLKMPQNHSERSHFQKIAGSLQRPPTPSWGTQTLRVLVNATFFHQGKIRENSGNFILDSLWAPCYSLAKTEP